MLIKKSKLLYILFLAAAIALGADHAVSAQDPDRYPQRIISLGPPQTEELFLLGVGDKVVGVTSYCLRPPEAQQKEKIGSVKMVSLEKIIDLKPDLVIATPLTDLNAIAKLRDLGIKIKVVVQPKDHAQMYRQFLELGELVGRKKKAEEVIRKTEGRIDAIKAKIEGLPRTRVFIQVGAKPLVTASRGAFINSLVELAGGVNVAADSSELSYTPYSREKVIEADPDCVIIVTMGIAGEEEKRTWEAFKDLTAVRNKRIYVVDSYKFCSTTPATVVEALKDITAIMHPDVGME